MVEYRNERDILADNEIHDDYNNGHCGCECCHCKKIFMMLVLLLLAFIAGIMVGNCGRCHYSDNYYNNMSYAQRGNLKNPKKFHRGMQQITPQPHYVNQAYPTPQAGGFVMEVDEID